MKSVELCRVLSNWDGDGFVRAKWLRSAKPRGLEWVFEIEMRLGSFVWKYGVVGVERFGTVWHMRGRGAVELKAPAVCSA